MSEAKIHKAASKVKQQVKKEKEVLESSLTSSFPQGSHKTDFISKYGIEMQMPANYIYESFTYRPNKDYVISATAQIFPKEVDFLDYNKIAREEDPYDNDFQASYIENNECLAFKAYFYSNGKYSESNQRLCSSLYQHKLCFSDDNTRLAIYRLEKSEGLTNLFQNSQSFVIDIFDCSSIDFFLDKNILTPADPRLVCTIRDPKLHGLTRLEKSFMRFSSNSRYIYVSQQRETLLFYEIGIGEKIIKDPIVNVEIPNYYEYILNVGIDEEDIMETKIAAKKRDFRNIELFSLDFLEKIKKNNKDQASLESTHPLSQAEFNRIKQKYPISSLRLKDFDLMSTNIRFSSDQTAIQYCDDTQNVVLELAQEGIPQRQKNIAHLEGKTCRYIAKYGNNEFLVATANSQDQGITVRHSSDPSKKFKFYLRFSESSVLIRDIYPYDNKIRILITRDDEEYMLYEWENFQQKETFWQKFFLSSNYVFEWPYLCYLMGQRHIIIQNAFNPSLGFFFELTNLKNNESISNMYLTDTYQLHYVVESPVDYKFYEKDLDFCMPYILSLQTPSKGTSPLQSPKKPQPSHLSNESDNDDNESAIAAVSKTYLGNKPIYNIIVRGSSVKEVIQTNLERIIFFLSNFKIFCIIGADIKIVDSGYKIRIVNSNLLAYNTVRQVDEHCKKTSELKMISVSNSDYRLAKIYEEIDGKIIDFLIQEGQLLVAVKQDNSENFLIKIFEYNSAFQCKLKHLIESQDKELIGNLKAASYFQGNMVPAFNDLYTIVNNGQKTMLHHYLEVLPLQTQSGFKTTFNSPILNSTYRRMIYFVTNKKFIKPKSALILPFITDNFTLFNRRTNLTQFCQFFDYKNPLSDQVNTDILCYVPFTKQCLHYNLKGQLLGLADIKNQLQRYGEKNVAISHNGQIHLQKPEDDQLDHFSILKLQLHQKIISDNQDLSKNQKGAMNDIGDIAQKIMKQKTMQKTEVKPQFVLQEILDFSQILCEDESFKQISKYYLNEIIGYFVTRQCEVTYRINDNQDILIGFIYTSQTKNSPHQQKYLKELFLIKKLINDQREVFKVRLPQYHSDNEKSEIQAEQEKGDSIREKLLGQYVGIGANQTDNEYALFLAINELRKCENFCLTNEKLIVWSKDKIYHGDLNSVNSNTHSINLIQSTFQIENTDEAQIKSITANDQNEEDAKLGNYYIYIKISVENSYSFFIKYNIIKNKEFASFDCSLDAQVFFDKNCEGFILDQNAIIDLDQGIPLYFYKTGMKDFNQNYLFGGCIDRGNRFCSQNLHFMVRNRFYLPFSYFILVLIDNNIGKPITSDNWDPDAFYRINGNTVLHSFANNYKVLEFILSQYERSNPQLLNLLFLKNGEGNNVLQQAISCGNTRCVKLILDKLSKISMNNIHALKQNFKDLLDYNGFEDYLKLCFFQTKQMESKQIFSRKNEGFDETLFIESNETAFLDKKFYENFQDLNQPSKQVIIRGLDAGWILKQPDGIEFQIKLSESDNMDYFVIDTVKLIVNYQWQIMKPKIIVKLFIPFIINMIIYNFYAIGSYEHRLTGDPTWININYIMQTIILLFTIQTVYVEYQQIRFHRKEYFQSFWNILDLSTVILGPATVFMDIINVNPTNVRPFMAICAAIFFIRFFYFLRIFDSSAHLIRTIIEITYDIRNFIFVFFLGIIGFGVSFQILSNNNEPNAQFINGFWEGVIYSYNLSLGNFVQDSYNSSTNVILIWSVFVISSLFTAIILLNMLVAIMGDSFNRVNEQSESQRVREHLQLIMENDFLIDRAKQFGKVKFLIQIKDDADDSGQDILTKELENIKSCVKNAMKSQSLESNQIKDMLKAQANNLTFLKTEIMKMKNMFKKQGFESESTIMQLRSSVTDESHFHSNQSFHS